MKHPRLYTGPRCEYPERTKGRDFCERPATQSRPGRGRTGNCFWFCVEHAARFDAEQEEREKASAAPRELPRNDVRRALLDLRVACDDADAVIVDALRPLRRRELGHVLAARNYADARGKITATLAYLFRLASNGGEHDGGAGPTH